VNGPEILQAYDDIAGMIQAVGWVTFIQSFKGHNVQVERVFARYFDGKRARVGDVELVVEENLIAQATGLPLDKEKWFKNT
jgi:hypothetical protein